MVKIINKNIILKFNLIHVTGKNEQISSIFVTLKNNPEIISQNFKEDIIKMNNQ